MEGEIPGSRKIKSHVGVTHLHAGGSSVGYNRREFGGGCSLGIEGFGGHDGFLLLGFNRSVTARAVFSNFRRAVFSPGEYMS